MDESVELTAGLNSQQDYAPREQQSVALTSLTRQLGSNSPRDQ
jgi:hypothetical protein